MGVEVVVVFSHLKSQYLVLIWEVMTATTTTATKALGLIKA